VPQTLLPTERWEKQDKKYNQVSSKLQQKVAAEPQKAQLNESGAEAKLE
jgi:hypothetical protein